MSKPNERAAAREIAGYENCTHAAVRRNEVCAECIAAILTRHRDSRITKLNRELEIARAARKAETERANRLKRERDDFRRISGEQALKLMEMFRENAELHRKLEIVEASNDRMGKALEYGDAER